MIHSHRPLSIVEFIPDDCRHPEEGPLSPQPGCHTGVDDHPQLASLGRGEAELGLHVPVHRAVTLLLPEGGVQDDLVGIK